MKFRKERKQTSKLHVKREVLNEVERQLLMDGITPMRVHQQLVSSLATTARQFALDPATAVRADVAIYLDQGEPEARWKDEIEASQDFKEDLKARALRRAWAYPEIVDASLPEVIAATDTIFAGYCAEAQDKLNEAESKAQQANGALRRLRDAEQDGDGGGPGFLGAALGILGGFTGRSRAVAAWNTRERETFRRDCAQAQLTAWEEIRGALEILSSKIPTFADALTSESQVAGLSETSKEKTPVSPHAGVTWEPAGPLVEYLTRRGVAPTLPDDFLVELLAGEDLANALVDRTALERATEACNDLAIGGLQNVYGERMKKASRLMLRLLNDGAGGSPTLYQIGEKHPETGEVSFVWPAVKPQKDVLATDGLSLAIGYLRIDAPADVSEVFSNYPPHGAQVSVTSTHTSPDVVPTNNGAAPEISQEA